MSFLVKYIYRRTDIEGWVEKFFTFDEIMKGAPQEFEKISENTEFVMSCMCTGRRDKDDVMIAEGSIVKVNNQGLVEDKEYVGIIQYNEDFASFMVDIPKYGTEVMLVKFDEITVLGDGITEPALFASLE